MIKRILPIALLGAVILGSAGCNSNAGFKKANGIEFRLVTDKPGTPAKIGDIIEINAIMKVGRNDGKSKDSAIFDTRKMNNGKAISMPLSEPKFRGDMAAGLAMMSPGDSAVIRVSYDSLKANLPNGQMPPFAKPGDYFIYEVTMVAAKSKEQAEKEAKEMSGKQAATDDKIIQDYLAKNNIKAEKTASGLYYMITKEGTGDKIAAGKSVTVWYTGKLLGGKTFDSNMDSAFHHNEPFTVKIGAGQVIPGWDEGVQLLKKGSKATLFIPSPIAYGEHAAGPEVPANSILVFDMEVTDVK